MKVSSFKPNFLHNKQSLANKTLNYLHELDKKDKLGKYIYHVTGAFPIFMTPVQYLTSYGLTRLSSQLTTDQQDTLIAENGAMETSRGIAHLVKYYIIGEGFGLIAMLTGLSKLVRPNTMHFLKATVAMLLGGLLKVYIEPLVTSYIFHPLKQYLLRNKKKDNTQVNNTNNTKSIQSAKHSTIKRLAKKLDTWEEKGILASSLYWLRGLKEPIMAALVGYFTISKFKKDPNIPQQNIDMMSNKVIYQKAMDILFIVIDYFLLTGFLMKGVRKMPSGRQMTKATLDRVRVVLSLVSIFFYTTMIQPIIVGLMLNKKTKTEN